MHWRKRATRAAVRRCRRKISRGLLGITRVLTFTALRLCDGWVLLAETSRCFKRVRHTELSSGTAIDAWMKEHAGELGAIAHQWFDVMRKCGDEVRELLHDGCPVACLGDAPFGYVNVFTSHVNVGFFHGAALPEPARLLQGTGKFMRHVKLDRERLRTPQR